MRKQITGAGLFALGCLASGAQAQGPVHLNEIYIDQVSTDTMEFIELKGTASLSLTGYMVLIVEGDKPTATSVNPGKLRKAFDLSALSMSASGFLLLADTAITPSDVDIGASNIIENGTETFYLIQTTTPATWTGLVGMNIDNGPTTTMIASDPNTTIEDIIAVTDGGPIDVVYDGATVFGPYGGFGNQDPPGIYRCSDYPGAWSTLFLDPDPSINQTEMSTAGGPNTTVCGVAEPGESYCFGDGIDPMVTTLCPCSNFGQPGYGCGNSVVTTGALLTATGTTSPDTIQFTAIDMPLGIGSIFLQGDMILATGAVFGDGIRCTAGTLIRMGLVNDTDNDGSTTFGPASGNPQISTAGSVVLGNTYSYQVYYRNPNPTWCPPATFNITQGYRITW